MAAEYVVERGEPEVILCERGIKTFERSTRYTLDLSAIPVLKLETHLPVIVDPSHAAGRRDLVLPLARAAVAAGADGIIVELHPRPEEALCDGPQQIPDGGLLRFRGRDPLAGPVDRPHDRLAMALEKLAIVGTGLIGASVGLAATRGGRRERARLGHRLRKRSASRGSAVRLTRRSSLADAVEGAELVIVAAPVAALPAQVAAVLDATSDATTVTDVGSTKTPVTRAVSDGRFIGGHPGLRLRDAWPGARDAPTCFAARRGSSRPTRPRIRSATGCCTASSASLGARPGRGRSAGARPARRADEPSAARARERAR